MPTRPAIRTATMADLSAVGPLLRELDDYHVDMRPDVFQPFDDPGWQQERVAQFVNGVDAELFVAETDAALVGLATVRITDSPAAPMFRPARRACMDNLVVTGEYRRSGIANILLDHVIAWTQSRGIPFIDITVWNENKPGRAFFTTQNFTPRCQQLELRLDLNNDNS